MSNNQYKRHKYRGGGNKGGNTIPDRWLNYDAVGRDVEGSRFVPFKTPLDARFFENRPEMHGDDYFDVNTMIQFAKQAQKRIGLVIDLTNTDRYYTKSEWKDHDIQYQKINCPGHEVSQREDIVEQFFELVDNYISENPDDSLIGVHCTHGLNRTGYLICRYLIDRMGWTAAKAISQFEYNRGHPIERGHYKKGLYEAEEKILRGETKPSGSSGSSTIESNGNVIRGQKRERSKSPSPRVDIETKKPQPDDIRIQA